MAKKNPQVGLILKNLESNLVASLYEVCKDKDKMEALREIMQYIKNLDMKKILDKAGGVRSLDSMINNSIDQSFSRGRISSLVLLYTLIMNAEKEMERREAKK